MKLYTHPFSTNARRAALTAAHLGVDVEHVVVDLMTGAHKTPAFLAINPHGRVPVLVDGDFVLSESIAIMTYLADKTGAHALYPTELQARSHVNQWLFWTSNHWNTAVGQLLFENTLKSMFGMGAPDPYTVQRAESQFREHAGALERVLGARAHVMGDALTLVDLAIAPTLTALVPAKLPLGEFPAVERWFATMRELPAWKQTEPPPR